MNKKSGLSMAGFITHWSPIPTTTSEINKNYNENLIKTYYLSEREYEKNKKREAYRDELIQSIIRRREEEEDIIIFFSTTFASLT